jgi:hypothetical protein
MSKASTELLEQGTQTPSPAPDLIPAETKTSTENLHWDRYSKRGHFRPISRAGFVMRLGFEKFFSPNTEARGF